MGRLDSEQRQKILEAAIEVFAEHGLKAATIRKVGERAGFNSALIYYYFENKDTLFVEAVRFSLNGFLDFLQAHREPFATARERLAFLVDGLFDFYGTHPLYMLLISTAVHVHPELMASTLNSLLRERVALPFEVLMEGIRLKQLRPENPAILWWSILGVCLFSFRMKAVFAHLDFTDIPIPAPDWTTHRDKILDFLTQGMAVPARGKKPALSRSQQ